MRNYFSAKSVSVALVIFILVLFLLQRFTVEDIDAQGPTNSAVPDEVIPLNTDSLEGVFHKISDYIV